MVSEGGAASTTVAEGANGTALNRNRPTTRGWLFVLPWSPSESGGVNNVVKSLIRCFRDGGRFSPSLLVTDTSSAADSPTEVGGVKPSYLNVWGPVDHPHPTKALLSFFYRFPRRCWSLKRIINQDKITVINPHFPALNSLTFVMMKRLHLFRGSIILSFHRGDIRLAQETRGFERWLWKLLLKNVDNIVVVSEDLGREVLALLPAAKGKVNTIYNGVDTDMLSSAGGERTSQPPCEDCLRTIISVGQFIPRKGHEVLVRAFSIVSEQFGDARLMLLGQDGPDLENIFNLTNSPSLQGRIEIHRNVPHEQVAHFLSRASLYVSASRGEGFPLAVLEAAAAGLPVICTRVPGLRELITDGVTGRLVEVDDVSGLADAIIDLLMKPEEAARLANSLYREVKAKYTWQNAYERYLEVIAVK